MQSCLDTTNLASPYLKTCFPVRIWPNLMHTNLITRLFHYGEFQFLEVWEGDVFGEEEKNNQKNVLNMILVFFSDPP